VPVGGRVPTLLGSWGLEVAGKARQLNSLVDDSELDSLRLRLGPAATSHVVVEGSEKKLFQEDGYRPAPPGVVSNAHLFNANSP
jgi:hypothetical protein